MVAMIVMRATIVKIVMNVVIAGPLNDSLTVICVSDAKNVMVVTTAQIAYSVLIVRCVKIVTIVLIAST